LGNHDRAAGRYAAVCNGLILTALLCTAEARAEGAYAGIGYAHLHSEDIETGNLSLVVGNSPKSGLGLEFFYAPTISKDSLKVDPYDADVTADAYGLLAYYKTASDDFNGYLKLKAGYARVDLELDFGDIGSLDDHTSGLAYGISFGTEIGNGALEFTYLILPQFNEFEGIDVDAEVDMTGIFYHLNVN
jgi:hypothetical protein